MTIWDHLDRLLEEDRQRHEAADIKFPLTRKDFPTEISVLAFYSNRLSNNQLKKLGYKT